VTLSPKRLRGLLDKLFEGIVVKLLVLAAVTALTGVIGYLFGVTDERARFEQTVRAAPEEYVRLLREQIESGGHGEPLDTRVHARSIVRVRDDLRGSLSNLAKHLNSEMDRLAKLLAKYEQNPSPALEREIQVTIRVLRQTWPSKETLITYELRKILSELGLDRAEPRAKSRVRDSIRRWLGVFIIPEPDSR
jgi:hypothetical protein